MGIAMDSFEASRKYFMLRKATWEYFVNGYRAKIELDQGLYDGYIGEDWFTSHTDFNVVCNRLITEIRNRESVFTARIGNLSARGK